MGGVDYDYEHDGACNTGLYLGLSVGSGYKAARLNEEDKDENRIWKRPSSPSPSPSMVVGLGLSFSVFSSQEQEEAPKPCTTIDPSCNINRPSRSFNSADDDNHSGPAPNYTTDLTNRSDHTLNCSRKKLRLTKEQSALLEESFKLHTTLSPAQKQSLAGQLNLKPRQVEVWFQNRRARSKLKQTEVDCEFLKKCCESLSDENRRLKRELNELRSSPLFVQVQKKAAATATALTTTSTTATATLTLCSSCEKIVQGSQALGKK